MLTDDQIREITERLRNQTDEEADAIWDEMVKDGIIDEDGRVLKKIPEPPDWLTGRNGQLRKAKESAMSTKPAKRSRKRS